MDSDSEAEKDRTRPKPRQCSICAHFLSPANPHPTCVKHRPSHRDEPCDLDSGWSSKQWSVTTSRGRQRGSRLMPQVTVGEVLPNGVLRISKVHNNTTKPVTLKYQDKEIESSTESEMEESDASEDDLEEDPDYNGTSEEDTKTRKRAGSQRNLPPTKKRRGAKWFPSETKALVEFLAMRNDLWDRLNSTSAWPLPYSPITDPLWMKAACYISEQTGQPIRTVNSVRRKVVKDLSVRFPVVNGGLGVALKAYNIAPPEGYHQPTPPPPSGHSQSEFDWTPLVTPSDRIEAAMEVLKDLNASDKLGFLDRFVDTMDAETVKTLREKLNQKIDTFVEGLTVSELTDEKAKT